MLHDVPALKISTKIDTQVPTTMVRKDHLDLNNIMERHPKRPRRSGGGAGGVVGDGATPPFSNSNDIIADSFNSSSADVVNGGEVLSSSPSVHQLYTATASRQQHQQQGRARRWVKALRQPQCMLNDPYFGTSSKANFCVHTWIPVNQLSNEERIQYEEREERINQERMIWWNKNINATTTTTRCSSSSGSSRSSTMKVDKNDDETEKTCDEEEDTKDLTKAAGQPSSSITEEAAVEKIVDGGHEETKKERTEKMHVSMEEEK